MEGKPCPPQTFFHTNPLIFLRLNCHQITKSQVLHLRVSRSHCCKRPIVETILCSLCMCCWEVWVFYKQDWHSPVYWHNKQSLRWESYFQTNYPHNFHCIAANILTIPGKSVTSKKACSDECERVEYTLLPVFIISIKSSDKQMKFVWLNIKAVRDIPTHCWRSTRGPGFVSTSLHNKNSQ